MLPTPLAPALTMLPQVTLPVDTVKLVPVIAPPVTAPLTANAVNVPTEVMFGCAAVVTVPAVVAAPETVIVYVPLNLAAGIVPELIFAPFNALRPAPDPLNWLPVTVPVALTRPAVLKLPPCTLPLTDNDVSVPTDVMLPCAAVVTVPAVVALVALGTVPVTLAPGIKVSPAPEPVN